MLWLALLVTFALSVVLCIGYRKQASRWRILDVPNPRSAHTQVTPRGGGVALFLALGCGCLLLGIWSAGGITAQWPALLLTGILVLVGLLDDVRGLSVGVRLLVYAAVCVSGAGWYLGAGMFGAGGLVAALLAGFYLLWLLNLWNFMDGIDGLAAVQTICVCLAAVLVGDGNGMGVAQTSLCLLLAAASAGFLVCNWPAASLFLGDAGSIPMGFLLGMLSLQAGALLPAWLILLAVFITDASYTLLWRIQRRQPFTQAHSLHLYQRLARFWEQQQRGTSPPRVRAHRLVIGVVSAVNVLWLLPLAWLSVRYAQWAWLWLALAYAPLLLIMSKSYKLP